MKSSPGMSSDRLKGDCARTISQANRHRDIDLRQTRELQSSCISSSPTPPLDSIHVRTPRDDDLISCACCSGSLQKEQGPRQSCGTMRIIIPMGPVLSAATAAPVNPVLQALVSLHLRNRQCSQDDGINPSRF